ncbi:jg843 [Pararge aegeria aegeria]|uniref:Jg843 protein n=1 Tax=Pararge aegeria aegeria TaxID=348720 RepID=A0A8S4QF97_9NEOP|nr:jg843 [Pararge aegeria aegeria]
MPTAYCLHVRSALAPADLAFLQSIAANLNKGFNSIRGLRYQEHVDLMTPPERLGTRLKGKLGNWVFGQSIKVKIIDGTFDAHIS